MPLENIPQEGLQLTGHALAEQQFSSSTLGKFIQLVTMLP